MLQSNEGEFVAHGSSARSMRGGTWKRIGQGAVAAVALVGLAGVVGCSQMGVGDSTPISEASPTPEAQIEPSVRAGSASANPIEPIVLRASLGTLATVEMTTPEGKPVTGEFNAERTEWKTTEELGYGRAYTITSTATDARGLVTKNSTSFTTLKPRVMTSAYLITGKDTTVGIGQPVAVMFDEPITDRQAAQDNIIVTTEPAVEGAFYWVSNQEVRWRPKDYWAPGTKVNVHADIYGKDLGDGMFGQEDARSNFTIGDAVISRVNDATKQIVVERNGEVVKTMPTSMGKSSAPTPNGTYIIGEKLASMIMDSSTYGVPVKSPDGYRTKVQWATRMSYSGIFVHAAPWSVWAQGSQNTSHGCLNVSTANGQWFYDNSQRGDIVIVSGTSGPNLSAVDGLGDWNMPWETWKAGNATAQR